MVQFKPFAALATDFHHRIDDMPMLAADESPPEHKSGALADFRAELDLHRLEQFRPALHARRFARQWPPRSKVHHGVFFRQRRIAKTVALCGCR